MAVSPPILDGWKRTYQGLSQSIEEDQGSDTSQEVSFPPSEHSAQASAQKGISQSSLHQIFIALFVNRTVAFRNIDALLHRHLRQLHPVIVAANQISDNQEHDDQRSKDKQQTEDDTEDDDNRQRPATKYRTDEIEGSS